MMDWSGKRVGRLTVIGRDPIRKAGDHIKWRCKCDCGKEVVRDSRYLKNSKIPSCGCWESEDSSKRHLIDLTGKKFGRLTVIERSEDYITKGGRPIVKWHCICDCGGSIDVMTGDLKSGKTQSCGCIKSELSEQIRTDIIGQKFGRLTVLKFADVKRKQLRFLCKCDCGNEKVVRKDQLVNGHTRSCGCYFYEIVHSDHNAIHGLYNTRIYSVYQGIIDRCYNKNSDAYKWYGGRGITMCDEWKNNPKAFADWSYANGYDDTAERGECTIDRIDVNGNYEPSNCRYVTNLVQQNNRTNNVVCEYNGESHSIADWARKLDIPYGILRYGIVAKGVPISYYVEGRYKKGKHLPVT